MTQGPGCVCGQELELWTRLERGAPRTDPEGSAERSGRSERSHLQPKAHVCAPRTQRPGARVAD